MTARRARSEPTGVRSHARRHGVFYTPPSIARYLVQSTFGPDALSDTLRNECRINECRILDPACGDGALLLAAFERLLEIVPVADAEACISLIEQHLFGVDSDAGAIQSVREAFQDHVLKWPGPLDVTRLSGLLLSNFRVGDSVSGPAWQTDTESASTGDPPTRDHHSPDHQTRDHLTGDERTGGHEAGIFNWSVEFPQVASAGGFDAVIGNPPYRRERGTKTDRSYLAATLISQRYYYRRMDLWHYFFHRALDLLKDRGQLTFIVNSYWLSSDAGRPLIRRLAEECTPREFVLFGPVPIFPGVVGHHAIFRVEKGVRDRPCRIVNAEHVTVDQIHTPEFWDALREVGPVQRSVPLPKNVTCEWRDRSHLFDGDRLRLRGAVSTLDSSVAHPSSQSTLRLGDLFDVRQGIAENPPRITRAHLADFPGYTVGEGVFVLTDAELVGLELSTPERNLLRPYYTPLQIERYAEPPIATHWLLYLTRQTAPDVDQLPGIRHHLEKFRPLLERRREVTQGRLKWWHIHWPRVASLFERPRILAVQMAAEPRFAYVEVPTFVGFSINLIVPRESRLPACRSNWTLEAVTAVLNSAVAAEWFDTHAKHRGVKLDITGGTLKSLPIPDLSSEQIHELHQLSRLRSQMSRTASTPSDAPCRTGDLEQSMEAIVRAGWTV